MAGMSAADLHVVDEECGCGERRERRNSKIRNHD
jgi:hypothetical protein